MALEELGDLAWEASDHKKSLDLLTRARTIAESIASRGDLVYEVEWRLARVLHGMGRIRKARKAAEKAARLARSASDVREEASARLILGMIEGDLGDTSRAWALIDGAIQEFARIETPWELAQAHEVAGRFLADRSADPEQVARHKREAITLYERLGAEVARDRAMASLTGPNETGPPVSEAGPRRPDGIVAVSDSMREALFRAQELAAFDAPVLVEGQTGVGKELIARTIHQAGPWRDRPFVALNCAAFHPQLLASELFGHRRGAFTGAEQDHAGYLEVAGEGIVFLDELDKAPTDLQAKLLRVLEERVFTRVGETEPRPFHARVICAANRSLRGLSDEGSFLHDLYFRIAAVRIELEPLGRRPEDVDALVEYFVGRAGGKYGRTLRISEEARFALMAYDWPGNVRELKHVVEGAAFFARQSGVIEPRHLAAEVRSAAAEEQLVSLPESIETLEREQIDVALRRAGGNKAAAARLLGVSRKGLRDRIARLGIDA